MNITLDQLNYVDLIVIIFIIFYVLERSRRGVLVVSVNLILFVTSIIIAILTYRTLGDYIAITFDIFPLFAYAAAFFGVFIFSQFIIGLFTNMIVRLVPSTWHTSWWSRVLAVVPAFIDGFILVAAVIFLLVALPLPANLKSDIMSSTSANRLTTSLMQIERVVRNTLGSAIDDSFTFITTRPTDTEFMRLPFRPTQLSPDPDAENRMLELVNYERSRLGIRPLTMDDEIQNVAREYSKEMWEGQFFSHVSPDGSTPFDRINEANIEFLLAGENLALAPSVEIAHVGLMNSPGHRANILNPLYGRVGIGVIDGGIYGKIYTQNFTN
jgi:uncharacterized protein YkwD